MSSLESLWASVEAVPPVQTDILTRTSVGNYDLLRSLGEGEFAKVQSCRKTGEARAPILAVKHISKSRLICSSNIKRTLRRVRRVGVEIRAMQAVNSLYVCKLYDVMHSPNYVHLVMENGGSDLYELIGDKAGMDSIAARTIALCLARGLAAVQAVGVVHRDLKPENVLCRMRRPPSDAAAAAGGGGVGGIEPPRVVEAVKLCDFGLCAIAPVLESLSTRYKARGGGGGGGETTPPPTTGGGGGTAAVCATKASPQTVLSAPDGTDESCPVRNWMLTDFSGSPGFVAPEIVTEDEYDGSKIDAFSLGCVCLELVLGHAAFDSVWMVPYSNDSMSDRASFRDNLNLALNQLRHLPEFAPTRSSAKTARGDAAAAAAAADSAASDDVEMSHVSAVAAAFSCLGVATGDVEAESPTAFRVTLRDGEAKQLRDLVFGLLEVAPEKRLTLNDACCHPWFAPVVAFDAS